MTPEERHRLYHLWRRIRHGFLVSCFLLISFGKFSSTSADAMDHRWGPHREKSVWSLIGSSLWTWGGEKRAFVFSRQVLSVCFIARNESCPEMLPFGRYAFLITESSRDALRSAWTLLSSMFGDSWASVCLCRKEPPRRLWRSTCFIWRWNWSCVYGLW